MKTKYITLQEARNRVAFHQSTFKYKKSKKKLIIAGLLSISCMATLGTNWMIPGIIAWGISPLSFKTVMRNQIDRISEKYRRWRYLR